MPRFVPVTDPEVPKSEQNVHSDELIKHRKWDNPHSLVKEKVKKTNYKEVHKRGEDYYRNLAHRDRFDYVTPKRKRNDLCNKDVKRDSRLRNEDKQERRHPGAKHVEYKNVKTEHMSTKKSADEERKLMESMGLPSKFS